MWKDQCPGKKDTGVLSLSKDADRRAGGPASSSTGNHTFLPIAIDHASARWSESPGCRTARKRHGGGKASILEESSRSPRRDRIADALRNRAGVGICPVAVGGRS